MKKLVFARRLNAGESMVIYRVLPCEIDKRNKPVMIYSVDFLIKKGEMFGKKVYV